MERIIGLKGTFGSCILGRSYRYSESSNTTVMFPLSVYSILIYLFCFNARMHLSSLLTVLGVGDLDLSNMDLIFQLNSVSIDSDNYEIIVSTARTLSR